MMYLIYNTMGECLRLVTCPENIIDLQVNLEKENYLPVEYALNVTQVYIDMDTKQVKEKEDYTLDDLPLPCLITIEGVEYYCETQPTFTFDIPGTYIIKVDAGVSYLEKEFSYDYQP